MKKLLFVTFLAALAGAAFGQEAVFKEVKGKVEYKLAGKTWQPAQINAAIPKGSSVSTGFKSSAVLLVNGSLLIVKPLTNLTIEEITKNQDGPQTTVYLVAGKVKTEVKPSVGTEVTNFTVKNPTATASVRGTGFEFDGESILVNHGSVELFNRYEIARFVEGGEIATAGSGASVPPPIPVKPPTAPVLTAEGGTEEVDQAVGQMSTSLGLEADTEFETVLGAQLSDLKGSFAQSALDDLASDLAQQMRVSTDVILELE